MGLVSGSPEWKPSTDLINGASGDFSVPFTRAFGVTPCTIALCSKGDSVGLRLSCVGDSGRSVNVSVSAVAQDVKLHSERADRWPGSLGARFFVFIATLFSLLF